MSNLSLATISDDRNYSNLNEHVLGSIFIWDMMPRLLPSLPSIVYGPIQLVHGILQETTTTASLVGNLLYLRVLDLLVVQTCMYALALIWGYVFPSNTLQLTCFLLVKCDQDVLYNDGIIVWNLWKNVGINIFFIFIRTWNLSTITRRFWLGE